MSLLQMMMAGLSLEYEGVITSGELHIATINGGAMFFHDSIDFSAYAGNDAGLTPYRFVFIDSAGKIATAYGGAAGGGEALGVEILINGDMESGDPPDNWGASYGSLLSRASDERTGGVGLYSLNIVRGSTDQSAIQSPLSGLGLGRLYAMSAWCKCISGSAGMRFGPGNVYMVFSDVSWEEKTIYTNYSYAINAVYLYVQGESRFDDVSAAVLTDVPATGLHLMSTKNGTTRNMASVEAGFNPNAIVGVKIYG